MTPISDAQPGWSLQRRPGLPVFVVIAIVIAAMSTVELLSPRKPQPASIPRADPSSSSPGEVVRLRGDAALLGGDPILAADGGLPVRRAHIQGFWTLRSEAETVEMRWISTPSTAATFTAGYTATLTLPSALSRPRYDIAQSDARTTLYAIGQDQTHVTIAKLTVSSGAQTFRRVALPAPRSGRRRDFAIGTWTGSEPDLYVLDRDDRGVSSLSIYSGESRFRELTERVRLSAALLPPKKFTVDVARYDGDRDDLILTKRGRTGSGNLEVHVLSGESTYRSFVLHQPTSLPGELAPGSDVDVVVGRRGGAAAVFLLTQRGSQAPVMSMFVPPGQQ